MQIFQLNRVVRDVYADEGLLKPEAVTSLMLCTIDNATHMIEHEAIMYYDVSHDCTPMVLAHMNGLPHTSHPSACRSL